MTTMVTTNPNTELMIAATLAEDSRIMTMDIQPTDETPQKPPHSVDLEDTASATDDGSIESHKQQSQDIWLRACLERERLDSSADLSQGCLSEEFLAPPPTSCSATPTLATTREDDELSNPSLRIDGDGPIVPISQEEQAETMHSHAISDMDETNVASEITTEPPSSGPANPLSENDEAENEPKKQQPTPDSSSVSPDAQQQLQPQIGDVTAPSGELTTTTPSANENVDASTRRDKMNASERFNASERTNTSVSDRMTASERWRDNTRVQGLPSVSRKIRVVSQDIGPPSIPRRTSIDSCESIVSHHRPQPKKSILKASVDEEIFVRVHKRYWKKLPPPDMDSIKLTRRRTLNYLKSFQEAEDEEEKQEDDDQVPPLAGSKYHRSQSEGANVVPITPLNSLPERSQSDVGADEAKVATVVFQKIYIREHQQTIGDNPSVSYGTPISLDWPSIDNDPLDFNEYESKRTPRTIKQLFLNHYQRKNILMQKYGHSKAEVKAAKKATNKARSQRNMSKMMQTTLQPLLVFEEMRESAVRKAKRRMSNGHRKDEGSSTGSVISSAEFTVDGQQ